MKIAKGLLLLLFVALLSLSLVSATKIIVSPVNETSNHIFFDETAHFTITIKNTAETDYVFTWNLDPVKWIIDTPASAKVKAGETKKFDLAVRPHPVNYRGPGSYVVPLTVRASPGDLVFKSQISLFIKSINERIYAYTPSVALGASIADEVDPRDTVSVQVQIRNRNLLDIEGMKLSINGENFQTTKTFSLSGLEEKTLEFRFDVNPLLKPDTYKLYVRLIYQNKTISDFEKYYKIKAYTSVDRVSTDRTKFFKTTHISTLTNDGNVLKEVTTDLNIKWYNWLFTHVKISTNDMDRVDRNTWKIILQPKEVATITIVENYRVLPLLVLIILLIIVSYFVFRSPIVLRKQTIITGKDEEGISEMKVRVFIKNRTKKAFYNVRVLDRAPSIATITVPKGLGVLEPSKLITTQKKGTIIKWDFETIEAYEERIVTYNIKAKLKIIGHLGLPSVKIKYETVSGQQRTTESGKASIGTK